MSKAKNAELNGGKKVIEFVLDSGETVRVSPLSMYHLKGLRDRAERLFSAPDAKAYERPIDPERAVFPDEVVPAEQNPDYQAALGDVERQRREWVNDQIILLTAEFLPSEDELVERYADERERLAAVMDLPDDDWEATWRFCLLRTNSDRLMIIQAAVNNLLLSEPEVRDGMRLFRPVLSANGHTASAGNERPSGAAPEKSVSAQHDV